MIEELYVWNQVHLKPPLSDKKFNDQLTCAKKYVDSAPSLSKFENKTNFIVKKIRDSPETSYCADSDRKRIGQYYIKEHKSDNGESEYIPKFTEIAIDAYPKKVIIYKDNPLIKSRTERTKIIFESCIIDEEIEIGPYDDIEIMLKELENKYLIINKKNARDALSCIINAFKERKMVETRDGITTDGYYLLNNEIKVVNPTQNLNVELDKDKVIKCISFLEYLATYGWKNKRIFPTALKWGLIALFSFSIKFASDDWFPWLQLYGIGKTGKTTIGYILLHIWNLDQRKRSIGFNNIDSIARLGHIISRDTYPILVNQVRYYLQIITTVGTHPLLKQSSTR